jgi:hypothetical protein
MGLEYETGENLKMINYKNSKVEQRCFKCDKKLAFFVAYIPSLGEACMDCYVEAAKNDEAKNLL